MSDLPPGAWSVLLVGHQWPDISAIQTLFGAAENRDISSRAFDDYADALRSARGGPLSTQEGLTAEDARQSFSLGEDLARSISGKSAVKAGAYRSASQSVLALRDDLSIIAASGNSTIESIQTTNKPTSLKLAEIAAVVLQAQSQANVKAATYSANLLTAITEVLSADDPHLSSREFASRSGVDLARAFGSPNEHEVREQTAALLGQLKESPLHEGPTDVGNAFESGQDTISSPSHSLVDSRSTGGSSLGQLNDTVMDAAPKAHLAVAVQNAGENLERGQDSFTNSVHGQIAASVQLAPIQAAVQTTALPGATTANSPSNMSAAHSPAYNFQTSAPTLSPENLANNFNAGANAGAPVSAGTEALSNNAIHAMQPQAPVHSQPLPPPPVASAGGTPLFETAHGAHTPVDVSQPATPTPEAPQTVVATPAAPPPAPPIAPAPTSSPAGPLPAYGADLRPVAATTPANPPPHPMTAPGSAPVNPNTGALNQPAVVRQQPQAAAHASPAGVTENAIAATATGAVAGAATAQHQAMRRLHRLLDSVARQEPKLHWMIGDRDDGSTVLATDLAGGWIPPHVQIPVGVALLAPERRSGPLATMLGPTTLTASHSPGQYIPPADDHEPVPMSIGARRTADVEELGWELSRATKWRDGLPRLAHTLAKAASSGSGYLESEIELLREHLQATTKRVLGEYPDKVDAATVGNWQLLASIDSLIRNERICANYHLAWFQALSLTLKGEARR